jgi:hypothetical protein
LGFLLSIRIDENLCFISTATRVAGGVPKLAWAAWFASAAPSTQKRLSSRFRVPQGKNSRFCDFIPRSTDATLIETPIQV